jgi:hypothetical protein
MALFKSKQNPNSITSFVEPWDVESMRNHPDYVEIDDAGNELNPRKEEREPWHFIFTPNRPGPAPKAKAPTKSTKRK